MIWRSPGVPSLLVTYGVSNDLFFSGHTALAVYGAIELGRWGGPAWAVVGRALAVFETRDGDRAAGALHDGRVHRAR